MLLGVLALASLPIALPILPETILADVPVHEANEELGEQIGWPGFARQVSEAWRSIPEGERPRAIVFTGSYGEAAALERFAHDLPAPYSGHNTYWWWRTPPRVTSTVLTVGGFDAAFLRGFFGDVQRVGTIDNGLEIENEEQGAGIWLCRAPHEPLPDMWPELRHYN